MAPSDFLDETRSFYDALAFDHEHRMGTNLDGLPLERALLTTFGELVGDGGRVLDAGSGPGRVSAFLAELGLNCRGVDLSPVMVALARAAFPELSFDLGSMTDLRTPDGSLDGLLAWYSLIHIPPPERPGVLAGFRRALRPGGLPADRVPGRRRAEPRRSARRAHVRGRPDRRAGLSPPLPRRHRRRPRGRGIHRPLHDRAGRAERAAAAGLRACAARMNGRVDAGRHLVLGSS